MKINTTNTIGILKSHNIKLSLKLVKNSLYIELLKWVQVLLLFVPIYFKNRYYTTSCVCGICNNR